MVQLRCPVVLQKHSVASVWAGKKQDQILIHDFDKGEGSQALEARWAKDTHELFLQDGLKDKRSLR